ncbi:hypothetical protein [Streptosporangium roseum]|uniref:hypothetical protein n=1 Tax=Streptosporangium roseum TaxID=2001 RepID=UPI0004CD9424|nr:hypothetical protein [Streptosporangium roseum]
MTYSEKDAKALREEFPRWEFRGSGTRRHWAIRTDRPSTPEIKAGCKLYHDGDSPTELAERLRREEQLLDGVMP